MNIFKYVLLLPAALVFASSCVDDNTGTLGDVGKTTVKLNPDQFKVVAVNAISNEQTLPLIEIYKEANGSTDLNKASSVTLKVDINVLNAYNDELLAQWVDEGGDPADFVPFEYPTGLITISPTPSTTDSTIVLNMAAGEFAKNVMITIPDALQFDFLKKYAIPIKLVSVSGAGEKSQAVEDWVVVQVMVKNKWDGKYEVTELSPMVDIINATLTGYYPFKYLLVTSGTNTCDAYWDMLGAPGHPISASGSLSYYGSFGLTVEFAVDGTITKLTNWYGTPTNTRRPELDPSGVNKWDPATGNIEIKYWMLQPSLVQDPPHIRTYFHEKWTYKGDR